MDIKHPESVCVKMETVGRRSKGYTLNIERFCIECEENLRAGISKRCSYCQGERESMLNKMRRKK